MISRLVYYVRHKDTLLHSQLLAGPPDYLLQAVEEINSTLGRTTPYRFVHSFGFSSGNASGLTLGLQKSSFPGLHLSSVHGLNQGSVQSLYLFSVQDHIQVPLKVYI